MPPTLGSSCGSHRDAEAGSSAAWSSRSWCGRWPPGPICGSTWCSHSTSERFYVRLHLDSTLEVWLICWSKQQDTGFHDHNGSRGAVAVTDGALEERRLAVAAGPTPSVIHSSGTVFSFGSTHIHDVSQTGPLAATSIHAYSPPLGEMGFYELTANGLLSRRSGDVREEFC